MGAGAEIAAGIASGLGGLIQTGYNIYAGNRDFDYQKALQQQIFEREDNAVQRRLKDLEAAGLNPNLAAGSAAGAGAVVGRSNTPQISGNPVGTALDAASAVQQLRAQRMQNQILNNQKQVSDYQVGLDYLNNVMERAAIYKQLGVDDMKIIFDNGVPRLYSPTFNKKEWSITESPLMQQLEWQLQNNKNSADLLQKDVDFYTADKIADYFGAGTRLFSSIGSGLYNYGKWNKYYR